MAERAINVIVLLRAKYFAIYDREKMLKIETTMILKSSDEYVMVDELALKYCGPNNLMRLDIQQVLLKNFINKLKILPKIERKM